MNKKIKTPVLDDPFDQQILNKIFQTSNKYPDRLVCRESSWLEYKESFNKGSLDEYAKTMAAFANSKGGYIVFGVGDAPRKLIGLKNDKFDETDPAIITTLLNSKFSPEIGHQIFSHEIAGKNFGLIYVWESPNKPIVAKSNGNRIIEGEIYYRYRGKTERIKFPELRALIENRIENEVNKLFSHINKIKESGVSNVTVLDATMQMQLGGDGTFIINEDLIPKIRFIKRGEFLETAGEPALRLIGDLIPVEKGQMAAQKLIKTKGIRTPDIFNAFFNQEKVEEPKDYVTQICFEMSAFLPLYYFIKMAKIDRAEAISLINTVDSRSPAKDKLLERLTRTENFKLDINPDSKTGKIKIDLKKKLCEKTLDLSKINKNDIKYLLQTIRSFEKTDFDKKYIYQIIKKIFAEYYKEKSNNLAQEIRLCVCHLDVVDNYNDTI